MFLRAEKSPIRGGRTAFLSRGKPPVAVKFSSIKGRELLCNVRFVFKKKKEKKEKQGEKLTRVSRRGYFTRKSNAFLTRFYPLRPRMYSQ